MKEVSLKHSLKSEFLINIRNNKKLLTPNKGGFSLWENREEVQKLLKQKSEESLTSDVINHHRIFKEKSNKIKSQS